MNNKYIYCVSLFFLYTTFTSLMTTYVHADNKEQLIYQGKFSQLDEWKIVLTGHDDQVLVKIDSIHSPRGQKLKVNELVIRRGVGRDENPERITIDIYNWIYEALQASYFLNHDNLEERKKYFKTLLNEATSLRFSIECYNLTGPSFAAYYIEHNKNIVISRDKPNTYKNCRDDEAVKGEPPILTGGTTFEIFSFEGEEFIKFIKEY